MLKPLKGLATLTRL